MGWQRELNAKHGLDVSYAGSYADRQGISIRLDYLPEEYWSGANVRDTTANDYLTVNVTNPFTIANFAFSPDQQSAALLSVCGFDDVHVAGPFSGNRLLRAFPQMNNVCVNDQPLGIIKSHSLEHHREPPVLQRASPATRRCRSTGSPRTGRSNEYDRAPTLWQTNNNGRPWRFTALGVYELPFGPGRQFLTRGWSLSQHRERLERRRHL